ncbi:NYN domain-containing protein [Bailinhaonella thermotolerans]|uniref:NYN domain-containing protein n=1 Tax=Bailinhaonella thermotolerans TaxID=1070861 RepID=UPI00192A3F57|nr:NYN domain-containing protein [Bailinhaonella thermotolerans]
MRIGVVYDGGWWAHVSDYYAHVHPARGRISFQGLHDLLRWHLGHRDAEVEAHYVRARSAPSRAFDAILDTAGVRRHDADWAGGQEKGADVLLALVAYEHALRRRWDVAVLLTGDADFLPLVGRLRRARVRVVVPSLDVDAGAIRLHTASALREAASDAPDLEDLLAAGTAGRHGGLPPFVRREAGATPPASGDRRTGQITRWQAGDTAGFLTEEKTGQSWFVSRDDLPADKPALPVGTRVSFTGRPHPAPGKRYPQARSVTPIERGGTGA